MRKKAQANINSARPDFAMAAEEEHRQRMVMNAKKAALRRKEMEKREARLQKLDGAIAKAQEKLQGLATVIKDLRQKIAVAEKPKEKKKWKQELKRLLAEQKNARAALKAAQANKKKFKMVEAMKARASQSRTV